MSDRPWGPAGALAGLLALGLAGLAAALLGRLPPASWGAALFAPEPDDVAQLLVHYSLAPRVVVAALAGAGLALAGVAFQQALRNPLASPSTLGVSAGAQLALSVTTLLAPAVVDTAREGVALGGAAAAAALVLLLSWRSRLAPLTVILAGMVTAMFCGAASATLVLFNERQLVGFFIWGSGALSQQDWSIVTELAPRVGIAAGLLALLARPLALLQLDDQARNLGLSVVQIRLACLALAVALTAVIVSAVGVIGFVGLAAPALAGALGARTVRRKLLWAPALGAALLFATDSALQALDVWTGVAIPTGAATALVGAPTLLWLASRMSPAALPSSASPPIARARGGRVRVGLVVAAALALAVLSLAVGRAPDGTLRIADGAMFMDLLPWRWPRTLASASAGAMLAAAGVMLQRLTGNPIASPDVLGVSSGAALGLLAALVLLAAPGYGAQLAAATAGGLVTAAGLMVFARRRTGGDQVLIAGVAIGAGVNALVAAAMATGDPRMLVLANWMAGSAYDVEPRIALGAAALALVGLSGAAALVRWLALAPLGRATMTGLGAPAPRVTAAILAASAALTAAATMAIGPLSFAGLVAPHLAAQLGLRTAGRQLGGAAALGGLILVAADWLGRVVYFPFQVPAGLVGMAIAGPVLMWLLQRR
ncbi:Fe(3+)-hydroxamate ABC transporter permease FhuB [Methylopila turkensis]|uniref:Fe3+-hydroxamate ABC transporter permease FhuB n=1 Tax=Methylopila turkensis TaxID=1437816 RepID=A0A9W6JM15_9HYPH|nr:Fe(3+)-hydroxamate ABC transporter permease FhuB [Methylopila turkensis]GLK79582.1 Fe3+-hydroxamate ABC transporter permease FhuB [Methylopila turkensis]